MVFSCSCFVILPYIIAFRQQPFIYLILTVWQLIRDVKASVFVKFEGVVCACRVYAFCIWKESVICVLCYCPRWSKHQLVFFIGIIRIPFVADKDFSSRHANNLTCFRINLLKLNLVGLDFVSQVYLIKVVVVIARSGSTSAYVVGAGLVISGPFSGKRNCTFILVFNSGLCAVSVML